MSLLDLLILNLGARFTKLLIESWLGKGAGTTIAGDVVDLLKSRFQSAAERKKAEREFEEIGDRMARELLPLFEAAERQGHVNAEAVVLALESTLSGLTSSTFLIQRDLDAGAILAELRKTRPLSAAQFSQAETDLYGRALERSARHLIEVASRLPKFEETLAARSLQQLSRLTGNVDEILDGVRRIEATVSAKAQDEKTREYEINYRLAVQRNLDYLEIFGIDLPPESRTQKLSVAYISLNLESRFREGSESLPAEALFDRFGDDHRRLLIRGDAGTGKSTLLRWAAMRAAYGEPRNDFAPGATMAEFFRMPRKGTAEAPGAISSPRSSSEEPPEFAPFALAPWRTRVPFLLRLRQCKAGMLPSPTEFPELVTQALGGPPIDWVKSVLKNGRTLLLLDGVDEIPNAHRETTRRAIADLVEQYPMTYFVITTRPRAVEPGWLVHLDFQEARINPLSELDRSDFIDRWHEAVSLELQVRGKLDTGLPNLAESLKTQLEDNPEVARLATNPLLCAMICALHRDRSEKLPERQRQLCEDLCHALLHRRERESGLNLDDFPQPYRRLDYPQKRAAVQELAHHMVLNEYSSVSTEEAQEQIGQALKQFPGHAASDAHVVLEALVERSGILREESPREISFIHNAFKELLAGDYFAGEDSAGLLAKRALDPTWQPVILFAVAADRRGFATKVIQNILNPNSKESRSNLRARQQMALRCRAVSLYIDEKLDLLLQQLAKTFFPPQTVEDAEALADAGNTAVPFLMYSDALSRDEAVACVRALRLIGTSRARQALSSFLGDLRREVVLELAQAVNPLEIKWVKTSLLQVDELPLGLISQVRDLTPLAEMTSLTALNLSRSHVVDLSPLGKIASLQYLNLSWTQVKDLSPLSGLKKLKALDLSGTPITNLAPIANIASLQYINLTDTSVVDLSPLAELRDIKVVGLQPR